MRKAYFLGTCTTCKKILDQLPKDHGLSLQDIKKEAIEEKDLDHMKELAGSYENLFTRRSMKYRAWNLAEKNLTEKDFKELILKEYTFLKRPVFVIDESIFIGNAKSQVEGMLKKLDEV